MNLTEFKMKDGDFELSVRTEKYSKTKTTQVVSPSQQIVPVATPSVQQVAPPPAPAPAPPAPAASAPAPKEEKSTKSSGDTSNYLEVKSPIVGTFYRSSSPDKPPYAKVGDTIEVGQVVCIVEAMKLFNEIESEVAGKVVKVLIEDAQPVEYDQVLFLVEPS
jgi:acetyl-CoA carboxylase biotin carboxyl carrier protein